MHIHNLFPTPIGEFSYGEDMAPFSEIVKSEGYQKHIKNGSGNRYSDHDVLSYDSFGPLREWIDKCLQEYYQHTFVPLEQQHPQELYITESWVNYANNSESHEWHNHTNSIISGVFYIEATDDAIEFKSPKPYNQIMPEPDYFNEYNSSQWWLPARTATLYLFPSWLHHGVPVFENREEDRISIAFNTFLKGIVSRRLSSRLEI
jgi:uncharacterized protein (TIGR02466 family)